MDCRFFEGLPSVVALAALVACAPPDRSVAPEDGLADAEATALTALAGRPSLAGVADVQATRTVRDPLGMTHTRVQQVVDGVPIWEGEGVVHLREDGSFAGLTDRFVRYARVDTTPVLDEVGALDAALAAEGGVPAAAADLWVFRAERFGPDHLAWRVQLKDLERPDPSMPVVFVDAHSGEILWSYDNLQTAKNRKTYTASNKTTLPGTLKRLEGSLDIGDLPVDSAHNYAGVTYDYYNLQQGRDSYDAAGATITSSAHFDVGYENAFWDGTQMVYGDGGFFLKPLSQALDVVSHELTHAVTEWTANLTYSGESGGLNEATSDIMAATIESYNAGWVVNNDTWLLGEDIMKAGTGVTFIRDMEDPPADGWSIDDYNDYFGGIDVHFSSGIANKAFTEFVGTDLTIEEAGDVWYRALLYYMTAGTDFAGARAATQQAAIDLFGAGSPELDAISAGWDVVNVPDSDPVLEFDSDVIDLPVSGSSTTLSYTPANDATLVWFTLEGTNGDADLYVSYNKIPTTVTYDCGSLSADSYEICVFDPPKVGTYHVKVVAAFGFTDVTVRAWQHTPCTDADGDGATTCTGDCDDANATIFPGADETCNGVDDDCDLAVDGPASVDAPTWHADGDADGYGSATTTVVDCAAPVGYIADGTDCNDGAAAVHPGVTEACNGIDDDCDATIDGPAATGGSIWHADADNDGYGDPGTSFQQCGQYSDWVLDAADCDDAAAAVNPTAQEVCDPADADEDCDGVADGPDATGQIPVYVDSDGDGYGLSGTLTACEVGLGFSFQAGDCDDTTGRVAPGKAEVCDGLDQDCDGSIDEQALDVHLYYTDADGDGYGGAAVLACEQPDGSVTVSGDCDDAAVGTYPGATDVPGDGIDQDCSGADTPGDTTTPTDTGTAPTDTDTGTAPTDPGTEPGTTDSTPETVPDDTGAPPAPAECGCDSGAAPFGGFAPWAAALLLLVRRRSLG